jgi:hypothetical protein
MEAAMRNVHERALPVPAERVGALLDRLASPEDALWPAPAWPPMRFDRPLAVGADGGHGPIRYHVAEYEAGRRVRFVTAPGSGLVGYHEFTVEPDGAERCVLRHVIEGEARGLTALAWPLAVRWLHDAVVEDLLDNAELAVTGAVARPAVWSPWVRLLRARMAPGARAVPVPAAARLARAAFPRTDFEDAWQVPLVAGVTRDPADWADATFRDAPAWVTGLLGLRNALVGLVGIARGDRSSFATVARTDHELLLGTDAGHLDFRASLLVGDETVTLSTVTIVHNARGRLYLLPVRLIHPAVVRGMLTRAARRLAEHAPPAPLRTGSSR